MKYMIRDEFNNVEITNDKQLLKVEFGKTQAAEFTSKKENPVPEGDLNEKYVGKTIKKETEVNVDYINKVPTHATQTVVQSTTTATGAAAATATTAVAASTVAVVAIATVTGISAALHDYKYEFKSLIISSNELRYELVVYDALQSEEEYYLSFEDQDQEPYEEGREEGSSAPFKLRVYNKNYDSTQYLWSYSTNYGSFDHLTLGDTYNIVISENRYGGEEIFSDTFTTFVNSTITNFTLYPYADFELGTFDYSLDYVDDDDSISEIALEFYYPEETERAITSFSLEKETGYKTVSTRNGSDQATTISLDEELGYRLSYMRGNESCTYTEGTIKFEDYAGRKTEFRSFTLDREANFIDNSITVQLDYEDGFRYYSDFRLELTLVPEEDQSAGQDDYYSQEIPLAATTDPQTIVLNEYEMYVRDSYFKYTYRLLSNYRGALTVLAEETTPFSFTDNSGGITEFRDFVFTKEANFLDNTFKVRLDYQDDFNSLFNFVLTLYPDGVNAQYDFYLEATTEEQTCAFNENQHWNFSFDYEYSYTLSYYDDHGQQTIQSEENFIFTDISGGISEFRGVAFDGNYVMSTGLAPIQLNYQDDFGYLSNFVLRLFGPIAEGNGDDPNPFRAGGSDVPSVEDYPYEIPLEKTTEVQYVNLYENDINASSEGSFLYAVTYDYKNQPAEPIECSSPIVFNDPDALSEVRGITFVNGEANFNDRYFFVQLDFQDDFGYFDNFALQVRDTTNGGWVEKELDKTTEPQKVTIDEFDYEEYIYPVDIVEGTLTYNLVYTSSETGDPATQYFYDTEPSLSFVNSLKSEFYGLETSFDFTQEEADGECRLPFRFDCVNDAEYLSVPEIYFTPVEDEEEILATISFQNETMTNGWQYGSFSPYPGNDFTIEDLTNGDEYNVVVACYEKDGYNGAEQRVTKYCEPHVLTLNQKQEIYSVGVERYITAGNWEIYSTIFANGDIGSFSNCQLTIESEDGEITLIYDIEEVGEYNTIALMSPKNRTATEQLLMEVFGNPVNITFKYSKPGSDDIITIDCYSNYLFWISN